MRIVFNIFLLFFFISSYSQQVSTLGSDDEEIGRLKNEIKKTIDDSIKCINHLKISGLYFKNSDIPSYNFHLKKADVYSRDYSFLKVYVEYNKSLEFLERGMYDLFYKRINLLLRKLKKFDNTTSTNLQLLIIQNISIYHTMNLNYDSSIDLLLSEGIPLAKKTKNYTALGSNYESIADSFFELDDFFKSMVYYKLAIQNYKKDYQKSKDLLAICNIYYVNCLAKLNRFDEANSVLNEVHTLLKQNQGNNLLPLYYNALGELQLNQKMYSKAIESFEAGLSLVNKKLIDGIAYDTYLSLSLNLAKLKYELKEYSFSLELLDRLNLNSGDQNQLFAYDLYYRNLKKLGDYTNSSKYLESYIKLKDSLKDSTKDREYRTLEARFRISEKEKRMAQLYKDKQDKEIRLKNLELYYGLTAISLLFFIILSYFFYKNYKNQKKLNEQQTTIHRQNLDFLSSLREMELMQAMIEGEESERKRISRDLHDGIGSRLSSLKMQVDYHRTSMRINEEYEKFSSNLNLVIKDLRKTANNLVPETLSKLGLDLALKDMCALMSNDSTKIHYFSSDVSSKILYSNQIAIFRIIQELIYNSLKYSNCTEIRIYCKQNKEFFLITIQDNGIRFSSDDVNHSQEFGLKNIKNRIELLNGSFETNPVVGQGTEFKVELNIRLNDD